MPQEEVEFLLGLMVIHGFKQPRGPAKIKALMLPNHSPKPGKRMHPRPDVRTQGLANQPVEFEPDLFAQLSRRSRHVRLVGFESSAGRDPEVGRVRRVAGPALQHQDPVLRIQEQHPRGVAILSLSQLRPQSRRDAATLTRTNPHPNGANGLRIHATRDGSRGDPSPRYWQASRNNLPKAHAQLQHSHETPKRRSRLRWNPQSDVLLVPYPQFPKKAFRSSRIKSKCSKTMVRSSSRRPGDIATDQGSRLSKNSWSSQNEALHSPCRA